MRIDVQCHVFPPEYSEYLLQHSQFPTPVRKGDNLLLDYNGKQKFIIDREKYDPANILKTMDASGVDLSLISCNIPDTCLLPPEHSAGAARIINESILDTCSRYPGRFLGLASIPWNAPEQAAAELHWAAEHGFKGVMVHSRAGELMVDDPSLLPLYSLCAQLDLPLVLHPTVPSWYEAAGAYSLIPMLSFQMDSSLALMRLILSGTLERNPGMLKEVVYGQRAEREEIVRVELGTKEVFHDVRLRFDGFYLSDEKPAAFPLPQEILVDAFGQ